jgi:hypothetical protein
MKPKDSERALLGRLKNASDQAVSTSLQVMLDFYGEERADGCPIEEDGDMLLFQWGTYDWGKGEGFELDLTRQFIISGEDEPYQLHMTLRFDPTDECRHLGAGNKWCPSPAHLSAFRDFIRESAPYVLLGGRVPPKVAINFGQV